MQLAGHKTCSRPSRQEARCPPSTDTSTWRARRHLKLGMAVTRVQDGRQLRRISAPAPSSQLRLAVDQSSASSMRLLRQRQHRPETRHAPRLGLTTLRFSRGTALKTQTVTIIDDIAAGRGLGPEESGAAAGGRRAGLAGASQRCSEPIYTTQCRAGAEGGGRARGVGRWCRALALKVCFGHAAPDVEQAGIASLISSSVRRSPRAADGQAGDHHDGVEASSVPGRGSPAAPSVEVAQHLEDSGSSA